MSDLFESMGNTMSASTGVDPKYIWMAGLALILIIGVFAIYYFRPKAIDALVYGPIVLRGNEGKPTPNSTKTVFDQSQVHNALGNNFTFSMFVYMDDVNRERIPISSPDGDYRFKPLLYMLGVGDFMIDPLHQKGRLRIRPLTSKGVADPQHNVSLMIPNLMISRWNQILFTIEGRSVDVYLNGAPVVSTLLENLPILYPLGVLIETSPDFSGQAGLFQAWPRRLTQSEISRNYKRNTDTRGKPLIPDKGSWNIAFKTGWTKFLDSLCKIGICGFRFNAGPLQYVDYEFA